MYSMNGIIRKKRPMDYEAIVEVWAFNHLVALPKASEVWGIKWVWRRYMIDYIIKKLLKLILDRKSVV